LPPHRAYGEPRFTQDVDSVAEPTASALPGLRARFPAADFYVDPDAARGACPPRSVQHPWRVGSEDRFREVGSDRHLRDIAGMLAVSGGEIDIAFVAEWARRLGVGDLWEAVRSRAQ
jgi:hypothetical protein